MFGLLDAIVSVVGAVAFVVAVSLGMVRSVMVMLFASLREWREKNEDTTVYTPPVTVLIAAHNEEKNIEACVHSVLASAYSSFTVLVVDDGSTDNTKQLLRSTFESNERVHVHSIAKSGKTQALLQATAHIQTEFIMTLDADTTVEPHTLAALLQPFTNNKVAAVAGNIGVRNCTSTMARFQALSYAATNAERQALDLCKSVSVVPGAIGAWRKADFVHALGDANIAGDVEMTFRTLQARKQVRFSKHARAFTDVPLKFSVLLSQRRRWTAEKWQFAARHCKSLLRQSNGFGELIAGIHVITVQAMLPLLLWWVDIFMAYRILQAIIIRNFTTVAFLSALKLYIVFLCIEFARSALAVQLVNSKDKKLLSLFVQQSIWNRQLHGLAALLGLLALPKGVKTNWDTMR